MREAARAGPSLARGRRADRLLRVRVSQYRIEGLGHLSTLVADETAGVAAVVDPRRDVDIYLDGRPRATTCGSATSSRRTSTTTTSRVAASSRR